MYKTRKNMQHNTFEKKLKIKYFWINARANWLWLNFVFIVVNPFFWIYLFMWIDWHNGKWKHIEAFTYIYIWLIIDLLVLALIQYKVYKTKNL